VSCTGMLLLCGRLANKKPPCRLGKEVVARTLRAGSRYVIRITRNWSGRITMVSVVWAIRRRSGALSNLP
jgi:hypothetical protein